MSALLLEYRAVEKSPMLRDELGKSAFLDAANLYNAHAVSFPAEITELYQGAYRAMILGSHTRCGAVRFALTSAVRRGALR